MELESGSSMEVDKDSFYHLRGKVMDSLEELEKYQKEIVVLKQQLKKHEERGSTEKGISEQKLHLGDKEEEIKN